MEIGIARPGDRLPSSRTHLSCPNHGDPTRPHACHECLLYDFVPEEYRTDDVPCHHIPLNRHGITVATPGQTEEELARKRQTLVEAHHCQDRSGAREASQRQAGRATSLIGLYQISARFLFWHLPILKPASNFCGRLESQTPLFAYRIPGTLHPAESSS
jgi:hypothetical protein